MEEHSRGGRLHPVNLEQFPSLMRAGETGPARVKYVVPWPHNLPK